MLVVEGYIADWWIDGALVKLENVFIDSAKLDESSSPSSDEVSECSSLKLSFYN